MTSAPLPLRIPGLRRYGLEIARLRGQLATAKETVQELKTSEAQQRRQAHDLSETLAHRQREVQLLHSQLAAAVAGADRDLSESLRKAMRYDYYWYNADKKIDLREIPLFGAIAAKIREKKRTFLHFDRLYTLWQGVMALPAASTAVVEVGAYRGGSARFVAEAMRAIGRELPFYVCDTFRGHVEVDEAVDGLHAVAGQFTSTDVARVSQYLEAFPSVKVVEGDIRETSARMQDERALGLVHIDVDVYPITRYCLDFFVPRVVRGGTIVVDDYGATTCEGAKKAVDEYAAAHPRVRLLHLLTGQAVLIPLGD